MNWVIKLSTIVLAISLLAGCSFAPFKRDVVVISVPRAELNLPDVDLLTMDPLEWTIITEDNVLLIFKEGEVRAYYAVTADGYESLSVNNAKVIMLLRQHKAIIAAYETYYSEQMELIKQYEEQK